VRIADANVVVGMVTGMTDAQWSVVGPVLAEAQATGRPVAVPEGAFVETEWVLRRRYGLARREIAGTLQALFDSSAFEAWDPPLATLALRVMADEPRLDLADCVLVARDVLGEGAVLTLDKLLARRIVEEHARLSG
jgi:predicted nucleic-acid-binding protein